MFKKSADLIHFNERTGSHATKGWPTGLVEQRKLDETDFGSIPNILARRAEISRLQSEMKFAHRTLAEVMPTYQEAVAAKDIETLKKIAGPVNKLLRGIRRATARIRELRAHTPPPEKKVVQPEEIERRKARRVEMIAKYSKKDARKAAKKLDRLTE